MKMKFFIIRHLNVTRSLRAWLMLAWYLCRLLEVRCDRSQRSGPQQSARLQGKVARGNLIRHQQPWCLQSSCYGWIGGHGLQLWSSGQNLPLPFCATGSPISPVLADLVMEEIEETAISTFPYPTKWWFRYVDDSHACLKKDQVDEFHKHLNSINPNTLSPFLNICKSTLFTLLIKITARGRVFSPR